MAIGLAVLSAVLYGAADFLGGAASRKTSPAAVVLISQLVGAAALVPCAVFIRGTVTTGDAVWGGLSGLAGGLGILFLYRALAIGRMGVVSPITAVVADALPILAGLGIGERPGLLAGLGIVLAVVSVVLVSSAPDIDETRPPRAGIATALLSGVGIGGFLILISRASHEAGLYPLLCARAVSCATVAVASLPALPRIPSAVSALPAIVAAGLLDIFANVLYVIATQHGMLSIVATLTGLYPASTIVLAAVVLRERLHRTQWAGALVALGGVALIAR